jgi:hypothetical protein
MTARWNAFWFGAADVAPLAVIRICTGVLLLYVYLAAAPDAHDYLGTHAWIDAGLLGTLRGAGSDAAVPPWWGQSIWFHVSSPTGITLTYAAFLIAIVCFTVGLFTRLATIAVWIGHLSFVHRAYLSWSGLDTILAMLLFYLCFAPGGAAFSVDRAFRRQDLPPHTWTANLVLRMIQVHMCIVYLSAGLSKLQGSQWWDGTAVWNSMAMYEFSVVDVTRLGYLGDTVCLAISNAGVLLTLALEIGFVFLIWNPAMRPAVLALAVVVHAGIGALMGMAAFGAAMLTGCVAFVDASIIRSRVTMRGLD